MSVLAMLDIAKDKKAPAVIHTAAAS